MAGLWATISKLFRPNKADSGDYRREDVSQNLRMQVLTANPQQLGIARKSEQPVWGILMETGYPEAVATLVAIADGTVSLYYSNGGGTIGAGGHERVRSAAEALLSLAPQFLAHPSPTQTFAFPAQGNTTFYFLTFDGVLTAEAKEADLGNSRLPLSPLFHKAHAVISEILAIGN